MTVALALIQSTGLLFLFNNQFQGSIKTFTPPRVAFMVLVLTAGTAMIMWLGELITQRGIGNGMSILIIVAVVFMEQGQRRIPVQYAKRVVGRRMTSGGSTYIPLKVNQAGVIPIIFASSVLYFPTLIASATGGGFKNFVDRYLANQGSIAYILIYGLLVVFFAYFYTAISFNPVDPADNIRKDGGFIPGIRPGKPTSEYLQRILSRITLPGSLFLATIALVPSIVFAVWLLDPNTFPFGG